MSIRFQAHVCCDQCSTQVFGVEARLSYEIKVADARDQARMLGWVRLRMLDGQQRYDLCPECAKPWLAAGAEVIPRTDGGDNRPSKALLDIVREAAANRAEVATGPNGEAVFINYGDTEQQMIDAAKNACPACFGSGYRGDVPKHLRVMLEGYGQEKD